MDPDRVLLAGDGVATGRGLATHDLGLPGHLARSLSAKTGHATDVDILARQGMTVRTCAAAITGLDLFRYDVILLALGHNEALALMSATAWRTALHALLTDLEKRTPASTKIFILSIPRFGSRTRLPAALAGVLDEHSQELNAVTAALIETTPDVFVIPEVEVDEFQPETRHLYRLWADGIASRVSEELDSTRIPAVNLTALQEKGRQDAIDALGDLEPGGDSVLNSIAESMRSAFDTRIAAITIVRSDTQTMAAVAGMPPSTLPRHQEICDVTIRRTTPLIIEDTATDSRYSHYFPDSDSPTVRFYAGCPIESPDGHRIGTVCVMDTRPRLFTDSDVGLLRAFAVRAQEHLWQ